MEFLFSLLIIWAIFGTAAGVVASNRGGGGCIWFFIGFMLGPIGFALAFTVGKKCPQCGSKASQDAEICPSCKHRFTGEPVESPTAARVRGGIVLEEKPFENVASEPTKTCPFCAERILAAATKCRYCGEFLNKKEAASE